MKCVLIFTIAFLVAPASAQEGEKWWLDCPGPGCPANLPDVRRLSNSDEAGEPASDKIERELFIERERALEFEIESLRNERDFLRGELKDLGRF